MAFGTVLRTIVGAMFGAIFGYILGVIIELFPGMGSMSLPALLAAAGFLVGAALGILVSLGLILVTNGVYARPLSRWAKELGLHEWWCWPRRRHWYGHSLKHGGVRAPWGYYGYDGCASYHGTEPYSVEDTLQEMDGYISYLEDLPKDRVAAFEDRISRLNARLDSLRASLRQ